MHLLTAQRRSLSPAWHAIWRRRRERLRYERGAAVRGVIEIWIPWGMREDAEGDQLAAAAAREQLRGRFPHGAIALGPGELRCDHRTTLASWRFAFTIAPLRLVGPPRVRGRGPAQRGSPPRLASGEGEPQELCPS